MEKQRNWATLQENSVKVDIVLARFEQVTSTTRLEALPLVLILTLILALRNKFVNTHSSFTKRCTFIKTLIIIYIKIRRLICVSVYDHHHYNINRNQSFNKCTSVGE